MLVLELLAKKSMYGYEMIQTLKAASEDFFALKEGTLSPILYRDVYKRQVFTAMINIMDE